MFSSVASEILHLIDPIANIKMNNKFIDETKSHQAESGDPGDRGFPASKAGDTHQTQL